ncbi:hypothetical protein [Sphingobacterium sp. SYP-B4668]|uniref:hypothetical protein n=1 Tax=Sphingobacterium sp. SYP-B4668 TaxID=2996035 RepID=UPI0022DE4350|nr:hypothetical protein [Sphingobacterium sp. SYP-B4668]
MKKIFELVIYEEGQLRKERYVLEGESLNSPYPSPADKGIASAMAFLQKHRSRSNISALPTRSRTKHTNRLAEV